MAKQSGLGDALYVGGFDIGGDISAISSLSTTRETLPSTGITAFAMERLYGKRDGMAEFTSYFNDATGQAHDALSALPRTDIHVMYLRGQGLGNEGIGLVGKQVDYAPNRGDDGSLTIGVSVQANSFGIDWGDQLTTGRQLDASAADGDSVDTTTSASFGYQAYLQVFSIGSGTASIDIEDSADDVSFAPIAAFTDVTAANTVERIQSASATATVRRYVRVVTSGVFTNLSFAVVFVKNRNVRAI